MQENEVRNCPIRITAMVSTDPGMRGKFAANETVSLFSTPGSGVLCIIKAKFAVSVYDVFHISQTINYIRARTILEMLKLFSRKKM